MATSSHLLSPQEADYIAMGVASNFRADGRARTDLRPFVCEPVSDMLAGTNGSARVCLGSGTEVIVGIKMEVTQPSPDSPDEGRIEFAVDCSPSMPSQEGERVSRSIARMLTSATQSSIDRTKLCIIPGQTVWLARVDACVLQATSGGLAQAVAMAVRAALFVTRIPAWTTHTDDDGNVDFELEDDPDQVVRVDVSNMPLCVSVHRIGQHIVIDADASEESVSSACMHVWVGPKSCSCLNLTSTSGGVPTNMVSDALKTAKKTGEAMLSSLDSLLKKHEASSSSSSV